MYSSTQYSHRGCHIVPVLIASVRKVTLITPPHNNICRSTSSLVHYSHGTPSTHCPTPELCSVQKVSSARLRAMYGTGTPILRQFLRRCEHSSSSSISTAYLSWESSTYVDIVLLQLVCHYAPTVHAPYLHGSAAATIPLPSPTSSTNCHFSAAALQCLLIVFDGKS